jgi:fermentation-respiration switch protein FrsA (DUF1100 family)
MAKLAAAGAALLVGVFLFFRWFERLNLYHPDAVLGAFPDSYGLAYEELRLRTEDGETLHGWFLPAPVQGAAPRIGAAPASPSPAGAVVIFHGNAGNVSHRLPKARIFHEAGRAVLLFDYRGYGRSTGTPSEEGTYRDAAAALSELERRGFPSTRTAYYGESLGCAVALESALRKPPAALVLDSPFTSVVEMAERLFPWLPARVLMRSRYDNLAKIGRLRCPLLVLHSPQDEIVPFEMGRRLFAAAPEPKEFFESRGGHNEGFLDSPGFAPAIARFLKRSLK